MSHMHRRFTNEQVRVLFQGYCQGQLRRTDLEGLLEFGKFRFIALLKMYRQDSETIVLACRRRTPGRLSAEVEAAIASALLREEALVDDAELPISSFNYTAVRDRLRANGTKVSVTIIVDQAQKLDCHKRASRGENTIARP